jgi:hypothetical protein
MRADQSQAGRSKDLVVFEILRDSKCTDCGEVIWKGEFLFLDGEQALCLSCADLDHLEYLPRGDAALTCAWRIVISPSTGHVTMSPRCMLFISKALLILARHRLNFRPIFRPLMSTDRNVDNAE